MLIHHINIQLLLFFLIFLNFFVHRRPSNEVGGEEGWLEAPGGLKAVDGVLLGGTGLGLNRFPAVAVVDERFKLSSFGQTSQPEWAAN